MRPVLLSSKVVWPQQMDLNMHCTGWKLEKVCMRGMTTRSTNAWGLAAIVWASRREEPSM